jgi:orotidine-5'-phosphate decarboxylase
VRPFGERLVEAVAARGPLCVGIDPHPGLLTGWGLTDDVAGLRRFALTAVEALGPEVAVLKPQAAFFERHGSAGMAVLEEVVAGCRELGALCLVDAKRGDIGSTMAAYADAFAGDRSPLAGDAVTASPYLGVGALRPLLDLAAATGRGVFVLARTSNPEGGGLQLATDASGRTVAQAVVDEVAAENAGAAPLGGVGVVVGLTTGDRDLDLTGLNGPVLAPGFGAQGGTAADLARVFGDVLPAVLPTTSREVLGGGPGVAGLREAARRALDDVRTAVAAAGNPS